MIFSSGVIKLNKMNFNGFNTGKNIQSTQNKTTENVQAQNNPSPNTYHNKHQSENKVNQNSFAANLLRNFFTGQKADNDKIIVILLIILLAREGADLKLLIALGYIIM